MWNPGLGSLFAQVKTSGRCCSATVGLMGVGHGKLAQACTALGSVWPQSSWQPVASVAHTEPHGLSVASHIARAAPPLFASFEQCADHTWPAFGAQGSRGSQWPSAEPPISQRVSLHCMQSAPSELQGQCSSETWLFWPWATAKSSNSRAMARKIRFKRARDSAEINASKPHNKSKEIKIDSRVVYYIYRIRVPAILLVRLQPCDRFFRLTLNRPIVTTASRFINFNGEKEVESLGACVFEGRVHLDGASHLLDDAEEPTA